MPPPRRVSAGLVAAVFALALLACRDSAAAPHSALYADRILVEKSARRLTLLYQGRPVKSYRVALGHEPEGRKQCQGDDRTPEGLYRIDSRNAGSGYHRSLHVSYPNAADVANARRRGCRPGGDIMIHGIKKGYGWVGSLHAQKDWTQGCIAVTDQEIEEIWSAVPNGTTVEIRP
ncbi:MAG TPA: L,D-transpeptidase family protein [Thermoanaerobaculia bacterium]|nr:L,D-transpeptidase family protein [Thermoanaerobaculia bacterium]